MGKNDQIMVSICCLVYNHEPFLRECFEGFVMQKTTFPIEVLVHDDASTDHSAEIIREYTAKYPNIFKPIYQTENQYSKEVPISATYQFSRAQGKYIAMCEGDDYWTDPLKLQKQVDFLESDTDEKYALCFHNTMFVDEKGKELDGNNCRKADLTQEDLMKICHPHTQTLMFRKSMYNKEHDVFLRANQVVSGDAVLNFLLGKHGAGKYLPTVGHSCYRIHSGGIWSSQSELQQKQYSYNLFAFLQDKSDTLYSYFFEKRFSYSSWIVLEAAKQKKLTVVAKFYVICSWLSIRKMRLGHLWRIHKGIVYNLIHK